MSKIAEICSAGITDLSNFSVERKMEDGWLVREKGSKNARILFISNYHLAQMGYIPTFNTITPPQIKFAPIIVQDLQSEPVLEYTVYQRTIPDDSAEVYSSGRSGLHSLEASHDPPDYSKRRPYRQIATPYNNIPRINVHNSPKKK